MTQRVGGLTNEKLKEQIHSKYGIRSLVMLDRNTKTVKPYCTYKFATLKELKETLRLLRYYPLKK